MNTRKRDRLKTAIEYINKGRGIVDLVYDEESTDLDNVPDQLVGSDRYGKMENAVQKLEEALEKIDEANECIREASA